MNYFTDVPVEVVQAYWDERPCNVRHSPLSVGTKEYFEEVAKRKYFVEPHILRFADFPRWKGKKVLEIGCGIGTDTMSFAMNGANVTVLELSGSSLELAQKRADVFGVQNQVKFVQGNAEDLTRLLPDEKYDLICSFGVIHHTPSPGNVISQLKNFMHEDSEVKIMVYNKYSWKVLWMMLTYGQKAKCKNVNELIAKYSEAQEGCPVTYAYNKPELKRILRDNGLRVIDAFIDHISPYKISDYIQYKYNKEWYFKIMPNVLFRLLEKNFGWHLCVTAKLN